MKKSIWFVGFLYLVLTLTVDSQERPPIKIFTPKMYGAENQNWSIAQSKEHYIYVANNKGLLEFNGASWKLYPSPNETIMRSVSAIDNLIYTGCNKEFGFWQRDEFGRLYYTSLSQSLQVEFLEEEEIWGIVKLDDYILFQSLDRIYIYNKKNNTYSIINSDTTIHKMFLVDATIYFQKVKDGIYKIENGAPKLVSNAPVFKNNLLVNIFNDKDKTLMQTEDNGFYVLENGVPVVWDIPANKTLLKEHVFRSTQLKDGGFVLGTRSNGILHLTSEGDINYHINIVNGLSNNTIHAVFEDAGHNIWLALDNGINCVNIKSPFRIYNDKEGKIGTVYASAVFKGYLYLGTNQGLYYKPLNSEKEFKFIDGTQGPVRCLVEFDDTLFCGHNRGTFVVKGNSADLTIDVEGTWNIKPIGSQENMLLQGNYNGLNIIEKKNNKWVFKNKIEGFDISSKFFEILDSNIFVSHEYKGVFKVKVDENFTKAEDVIKDTIIDKGANSSLVKYHEHIYYTYREGVFKYDLLKNSFSKDSVFSNFFTQKSYTSGKLIFDGKNDILWGFSRNNLNYVSPDKLSGITKVRKIPFSSALPKGLTGYENVSSLRDMTYLIGTSTGYVVVDMHKLQDKTYDISINSIEKGNHKNERQVVNKSTAGDFKNTDNSIEFKYCVAEFKKYLDTEYQYQLKGIYPQWSGWSTSSSVLFENLPYGDYRFNVRAKVGNNLTKNIATYEFTIQRPWYLSNVFIAIYVLALTLFSLFMHNIYKRYYRKQQERLMQRANRDLELKELENRQQLMRFNNESLRRDIENKNRELGLSTMNLIKKNELLNQIKNELKKISNADKELRSVVRIIDKNLNNTDDWTVFEEAFNNADKDFLRKIKTLHPTLTSNDLRLCAYLRLNLSSKEIAPLLNISPRSVEVKRYRLRKKMALPHESSLTNYILEI